MTHFAPVRIINIHILEYQVKTGVIIMILIHQNMNYTLNLQAKVVADNIMKFSEKTSLDISWEWADNSHKMSRLIFFEN